MKKYNIKNATNKPSSTNKQSFNQQTNNHSSINKHIIFLIPFKIGSICDHLWKGLPGRDPDALDGT